MLNITRRQALKRWDALPMNLREALFSEYNSSVLWKICEGQHLSEDKIYKIATLTGDVLMGFTHPEDLAQEIKNETGIVMEIANAVSSDINRKIFVPIRSEIDKVYSPVLAKENTPLEVQEEHIVDLRTLKLEEAAIKEEIPMPSAVNQVEPMIIHKEESAKPVLGAKRSLGGLFGFLRGEKEVESKAVEAKIEIGADADLESSKVKVVHYSEFLTPVDGQSQTAEQNSPQSKQSEIDDQQPIKQKEIESSAQMAARVFEKIDLRTAINAQQQELSVPIPPIPPQEQKIEIKEGEEVIDLRTMKKIEKQ